MQIVLLSGRPANFTLIPEIMVHGKCITWLFLEANPFVVQNVELKIPSFICTVPSLMGWILKSYLFEMLVAVDTWSFGMRKSTWNRSWRYSKIPNAHHIYALQPNIISGQSAFTLSNIKNKWYIILHKLSIYA